MTGPKIYFEIPLFGGIPITQTAVSSFVVMVLLCVAGCCLGRNLKKRPGKMQVMTEKLVGMLYGMVEDTMGKHNSYWTPYIGALFLSSVGGSLIGMTGILRSATADLSTTLVWALMTSILVWACNIRASGVWGWLKGFADPIPVMLPMNIISEIAQPISMAFRHFGNIMGGGVLMSLLYSALAAASSVLLDRINSSGIVVAIVVMALGVAAFAWGTSKKKFKWKLLGAALFLIGLAALLEGLAYSKMCRSWNLASPESSPCILMCSPAVSRRWYSACLPWSMLEAPALRRKSRQIPKVKPDIDCPAGNDIIMKYTILLGGQPLWNKRS